VKGRVLHLATQEHDSRQRKRQVERYSKHDQPCSCVLVNGTLQILPIGSISSTVLSLVMGRSRTMLSRSPARKPQRYCVTVYSVMRFHFAGSLGFGIIGKITARRLRAASGDWRNAHDEGTTLTCGGGLHSRRRAGRSGARRAAATPMASPPVVTRGRRGIRASHRGSRPKSKTTPEPMSPPQKDFRAHVSAPRRLPSLTDDERVVSRPARGGFFDLRSPLFGFATVDFSFSTGLGRILDPPRPDSGRKNRGQPHPAAGRVRIPFGAGGPPGPGAGGLAGPVGTLP